MVSSAFAPTAGNIIRAFVPTSVTEFPSKVQRVARKVKEWIPSKEKIITNGVLPLVAGAGGYYWAGSLGGVINTATYFLGRRLFPDKEEPLPEPFIPPAVTWPPITRPATQPGPKLAKDTELKDPVGAPPKMGRGGRSWILSSVLQALILNEPLFLKELPCSIQRRMNDNQLFETVSSLDEIWNREELSPAKRDALLRVVELIRKPKVGLVQFSALRKNLEILAEGDFPDGMKKTKARELLALLSLYKFVREAQRPNAVISADAINQVLDSICRASSGHYGSYDAFKTVADLIFEKSRYAQKLTTSFKCKIDPAASFELQANIGNSATGEIDTEDESDNWGCFELNIPKGGSLETSLKNRFTKIVKKTYPVVDKMDAHQFEAEFDAVEIDRMEYAPKLLVLKGDISGAKVPEYMELAETYFAHGRRKGCYELFGVVGTDNTAEFRRSDNTSYFCDDQPDVHGQPIVRSTSTSLKKAAEEKGSILLYRRVEERNNTACVIS